MTVLFFGIFLIWLCIDAKWRSFWGCQFWHPLALCCQTPYLLYFPGCVHPRLGVVRKVLIFGDYLTGLGVHHQGAEVLNVGQLCGGCSRSCWRAPPEVCSRRHRNRNPPAGYKNWFGGSRTHCGIPRHPSTRTPLRARSLRHRRARRGPPSDPGRGRRGEMDPTRSAGSRVIRRRPAGIGCCHSNRYRTAWAWR